MLCMFVKFCVYVVYVLCMYGVMYFMVLLNFSKKCVRYLCMLCMKFMYVCVVCTFVRMLCMYVCMLCYVRMPFFKVFGMYAR